MPRSLWSALFGVPAITWSLTAWAQTPLPAPTSDPIKLERPELRGTRVPSTAAGPSGVAATAFPTIGVVTWQPVGGATGYSVQRAPAQDGSFVDLTPTPLGLSSARFEDHGLDPGTTFWYRVAALYPDAQVGVSAPVSVTPPRPTNPGSLQVGSTLPAITIGPQSLNVTPGSASLSWDPVPGAAFYMVYWSMPFGSSKLLSAPDPQAVVPIPEPGSYTFSVVAYFRNEARQVNYGDETTPIKISKQIGPVGPPNVRPEAYRGVEYMRLNWNEPPGVLSRRVFRAAEGQTTWAPSGLAFSNGIFEDRFEGTPAFGHTFLYRVVLQVADGRTWFSPEIRVAIPPAIPFTGLVVTSPSPGTALLHWDPAPGAIGYQIWSALKPTGGFGHSPQTWPASAVEASIGGLSVGRSYQFIVYAMFAEPRASASQTSGDVKIMGP